MARAKVVLDPAMETDEIQHPATVSPFPDQQQEPEDVALANLLADIGGIDSESRVNVYRALQSKGMKGGAYLFSCHPAEFSLDKLRDAYGGGDYRVHVRSNGRLVANQLVSIEEAKKPQPDIIMPARTDSSDVTKLGELMMQGFQQLGQLVAQSVGRPQSDASQTRRELLQDMVTMKQLFGDSRSDPSSIMEMFLRGVEFAKGDGSPPPGESTATDVLLEAMRTFGRPIAEAAMSQLPKAGALPQVGVMAAPGAVPPLPNPAPEQSPQPAAANPDQLSEHDNMMRMYVAMLVNLAREQRDPSLYAELILDQAPENMIEQILALPDVTEYLAKWAPEVRRHREWVESLKAEIVQLLQEDSASDTVPSHPLTIEGSHAPARVEPSPATVGRAHGDTLGQGRDGGDAAPHGASGQGGKKASERQAGGA